MYYLYIGKYDENITLNFIKSITSHIQLYRMYKIFYCFEILTKRPVSVT